MGLFSKKAKDGDTGVSVYGLLSGNYNPTTKDASPIEVAAEKEITPNFPVTFDGEMFDEEDIEMANELAKATRDELLGTAMLYLAAAEINTDATYATISMAYVAMAATRPATPQDA